MFDGGLVMSKQYDEHFEDAYLDDETYESYADYNPTEDFDLYDAYDDACLDELPSNEKRLRRVGRFKLAKGMFDFFAVILGVALVLLAVALIITLVNWTISDLTKTFGFLWA